MLSIRPILHLQTGDKQKIDNLMGVVLLKDNDLTARWLQGHEILVLDRNSFAVRHVNKEWPKRLCIQSRTDLTDLHYRKI